MGVPAAGGKNNIEWYTCAKFLDYVSFDQVEIGMLDLIISNSGSWTP
jgi:hypothetical protein